MLKDVLFYYVNMGASQFLKDFRLSYELKKSVELRKKILQRKEKLKLQQDKLSFEVCMYYYDHQSRMDTTKFR